MIQKRNLKLMELGEPCLFYHSNEGKEVVGIAEVSKTHFPDPSIDNDTWVAVNVKPVKALKNTVTLAAIKSNPELSKIGLVRQGRLSVVEITEAEFNEIIKMSETA